jgi:hypothetical protein
MRRKSATLPLTVVHWLPKSMSWQISQVSPLGISMLVIWSFRLYWRRSGTSPLKDALRPPKFGFVNTVTPLPR